LFTCNPFTNGHTTTTTTSDPD
jgi:hypothetical protein